MREGQWDTHYRSSLDRFSAIQTSTLLVLGGDSPTFLKEGARRLEAVLPKSRVHVMPGQQHVAMDHIPEEFVEAVRSFALEQAM